MKVIIHLSGGEVTRVEGNLTEVEVEVRQYHSDFWADRELHTDADWPGCVYELEHPPPPKKRRKR